MSTTLKALAEAGHDIEVKRTDTGFLLTARKGRSETALESASKHVEGNTLNLEEAAVSVKAQIDAAPVIVPTREEVTIAENETKASLRALFPGARAIVVQITYDRSP